MNKKPLTNISASVKARLLKIRTATGEDYNELLVRFSLERLLYRISISEYREQFILKGAMLFVLWNGFMHRRTRDMDLLGFGDPDPAAVAEVFKKIAGQPVPVDDGIVFDVTSVESSTIKAHDEYVGSRVGMAAFIGTARLWLQIDVGYGDSITPAPVESTYPTLLDFPNPILRCYAPETALAEKFEAVITLGLINSRMKDYFDFWVLGNQFPFDGEILSTTIRKTFARRGTPLPQEIPEGLSVLFSSDPGKVIAWRAFWKKSVPQQLMVELDPAVRFAAEFLLPPALAAATGEPFTKSWQPGGPWKEN